MKQKQSENESAGGWCFEDGAGNVWRFVEGGRERLAWQVHFGLPALAGAVRGLLEGRQGLLHGEPLATLLARVGDHLRALSSPGADGRVFLERAFAARLVKLAIDARAAGDHALHRLLLDHLRDAGVSPAEGAPE